ncbi:hypothetical protein WDW37_15780 [Bdellovibrionota bacterium FG-1]
MKNLTAPILMLLCSVFASNAKAVLILPGVDFERSQTSRHFEIWKTRSVPWKSSQTAAYLLQIEDAYRVATRIFHDPRPESVRISHPVQIALMSPSEFSKSGETSRVERMGFFSPSVFDEQKRDMIFLDVSHGLNSELIHRTVHELQHLFLHIQHPGESVWINEGLSELLAWRVSSLVPSIATDAFLNAPVTPGLQTEGSREFSLENYGQSYLFFRFLWEDQLKGGGDRLFEVIAKQTGRGAAGLMGALTSLGVAPKRGLNEIYEDFLISLLIRKDQRFSKAPTGLLAGRIPGGFSFALVELSNITCALPIDFPVRSFYVTQGKSALTITPVDTAQTQDSSPPNYLLLLNEYAAEIPYDVRPWCH